MADCSDSTRRVRAMDPSVTASDVAAHLRSLGGEPALIGFRMVRGEWLAPEGAPAGGPALVDWVEQRTKLTLAAQRRGQAPGSTVQAPRPATLRGIYENAVDFFGGLWAMANGRKP